MLFHAMQSARAAALLLAATWAVSSPANAQGSEQQLRPKLFGKPLVEALHQGGYVILFRHAATEEVTPDLNAVDIADCSTQRNLSEQGRREAVLIGKSFAALGIRVEEVLSSPYCRCIDTAKLAFGKATPSDVLRVGDALPGEEEDEDRGGRVDPGVAIRKLLDTPPKPGENTVLVGHTNTLLYAYGLNPRPEGVAHVFKPTGFGLPEYIGMISPEEWPALAGIDAEER